MLRRSRRAAAFCLLALLCPRTSDAHKNGIAAQGCTGCHGSAPGPAVSLTASNQPIGLGQQITLTIGVQNRSGPVAGFYLQSSAGTLRIVDSGTKTIGAGVTHTEPRTGSGGQSTFTVGWTAPQQPGGVDFEVWAISGNGDGTSRGDSAGQAFLSVAYGCGAGTKYFRDFDGDGYGGIDSGYSVSCSQPQYYAAQGGDCDDNDEHVNPGAAEICDGKDNDCNGMIDEGLPLSVYCEDDDGDGHGVTGKATGMACGVGKGLGECDGDCDDTDPDVHPGAQEVCNNRDDNCNGRIDEDALLECGVGWCRRYGAGCASNLCTPGQPRAEQCNDFDDDCDGVVDNGTDLALCGKAGFACVDGECVASADAGGGTKAGVDSNVPSVPVEASPSHYDDNTTCSVSRGPSPATSGQVALLLGLALVWRRRVNSPLRSRRSARSTGSGS